MELLENLSFYYYEYMVKTMTISYPNGASKETKTIYDMQIQNIYLERNYEEDYVPVFLVTLSFPEDVYRNMCKHAIDTEIMIHLISYINEDGDKQSLSTLINDKFVPLAIDGTPFINQNSYEAEKENSDIYGDGELTLRDFTQSHTLVLVKKQVLDNTRAVCNQVFSSISLLDAITYLFTKTNTKKILMSPFDNHNIYKELILLPIPLISQLNYLASFYGFHKEGTQIFFDYNMCYLLRKSASCSAYEEDEINTVIFCVYDDQVGNSIAKGSFIDYMNKTAYIASGMDQFLLENKSLIANQTIGENSVILNSNGSVSTANDKKKSYGIITTTTHNPYYSQEMNIRLYEMQAVITITCTGIDLSLLKPNRTYRILSNSSKISSELNYPCRLISVSTTWEKNGDSFIDFTTIVLVKSK